MYESGKTPAASRIGGQTTSGNEKNSLVLHPLSGIIGHAAILLPKDVKAIPVEESSYTKKAEDLLCLKEEDTALAADWWDPGPVCLGLSDGVCAAFPLKASKEAPCRTTLGSQVCVDDRRDSCPCCNHSVVLVSWDQYGLDELGFIIDELLRARSKPEITGVRNCAIIQRHVIVQLDFAPRCRFVQNYNDADKLASRLEDLREQGWIHGGINERWINPGAKEKKQMLFGFGLTGLYAAWRKNIRGLLLPTADPENWLVSDPRFVSSKEIIDGTASFESDSHALAAVIASSRAIGNSAQTQLPWDFPVQGVNSYFARSALKPMEWIRLENDLEIIRLENRLFYSTESANVADTAEALGALQPSAEDSPEQSSASTESPSKTETAIYASEFQDGKNENRKEKDRDRDRDSFFLKIKGRLPVIASVTAAVAILAGLVVVVVCWSQFNAKGSASSEKSEARLVTCNGEFLTIDEENNACRTKDNLGICSGDDVKLDDGKCVPARKCENASPDGGVNEHNSLDALLLSNFLIEQYSSPIKFKNASLNLGEKDKKTIKEINEKTDETCRVQAVLYMQSQFHKAKSSILDEESIPQLRDELQNRLPQLSFKEKMESKANLKKKHCKNEGCLIFSTICPEKREP